MLSIISFCDVIGRIAGALVYVWRTMYLQDSTRRYRQHFKLPVIADNYFATLRHFARFPSDVTI
jgi:hypothetical protein